MYKYIFICYEASFVVYYDMDTEPLTNYCLVCNEAIPPNDEDICVNCVENEEKKGKGRCKCKRAVYSTSIGEKFQGVKIG